MATKAKSIKTEKSEWTSKTITEWTPEGQKAITWKAQISKAPDGTQFIGVRQYITTAKMGEIASKGGISIKLDDKSEECLTRLTRMFNDLKMHIAEDGSPKVAVKNLKVVKAPEVKDDFILVKNTGKYLTSFKIGMGAKVSSDLSRAQLFTKERADALLLRLSDAWEIKHYPDWLNSK